MGTMNYPFSELIDVGRVQGLTDLFSRATGIPASIVGLDGSILTGSGWQDICTHFHRVNPETRQRCIESGTRIANQLEAGSRCTVSRCKNGLIDGAAPITIEGEHLANFVIGQFLFQPPDLAFFQQQAKEFGFDESAYMEAVAKIPVVDEARLPVFLEYCSAFAEILAEMGLRQAKLIEAEDALQKSYDDLELRVQGRTLELQNAYRAVEAEIVERREAEAALRKTNDLLKLYTAPISRQEYLDAVAKLLREWAECEALGIRVLDREGNIPYGSYLGFSKKFWESENCLSLDRDQCVCTRVVKGGPGPEDMPYITTNGSFHCDDTAEILSILTPEAKERFRGKCMEEGYASVTVIPISYRNKILGAIHLADHSKAKIPARTVEFIESVQALIGETIHGLIREEESGRLEQQLFQAQKMEALGTAAGGIAHDFNNFLSVIIGFTEVVQGRVAKGSREEHHLGRVLEAGLRGRELIRQMLTFASFGKHEKKPLRLSGVIQGTMDFLRASMPSTISIRVDVESESGPILGDINQIRQVLVNLCSNAAFAMREKGGVLRVELSDFSVPPSQGDLLGMKPGLYMKLSVADTGEGMPPEIVHRVFDPFFTTKHPGEASGLGLSVVHGMVKQHGGSITVESEPGRGSIFTVYLPKATEKPPGDGVTGEDIPAGTERVLFIDDEEALVEIGRELLEELGYRVTAATGSLGALAAFKADPSRFDLVITDQTMPDMTGIELAKEILTLKPEMAIIMCTGFSDLVDAGTAQAAGIKAFAMKPLTKGEIARIIRKVLDEQPSEALHERS